VGAGALFGIDYLRYRTSPDYQALQEVKRIEKEIADDPYGGDTPEETLRLFIDALKKGDTDLAAKYFVYGEQEEWREDLAMIKDKGLLDAMMRDLERVKKDNIGNDIAYYFLIARDGQASPLVLVRGQNLKWKIRKL